MIYAWNGKNDRRRVNDWRNMISPKLRLIHSPPAYSAARPGDLAFVNDTDDALRVAETPEWWGLAILGDERNVHGPSGDPETPKEYMSRLAQANEILRSAGVPTSSAGLAMAGGEFDRAYQEELLPYGNLNGQNFRPASYRKAIRGMAGMGDVTWFPTIIPVRANWWPLQYNSVLAYLHQHFLVRPTVRVQIEVLLDHPRMFGVGIWCLHETHMPDGNWQGHHGMIDRHDRLTWQGRLVKQIIEERYP